MNCNTGELIRLRNEGLLPRDFISVPPDLVDEAFGLLGENESAMVDFEKPTPLTEWALGNRKSRRRKDKQRSKRRR